MSRVFEIFNAFAFTQQTKSEIKIKFEKKNKSE